MGGPAHAARKTHGHRTPDCGVSRGSFHRDRCAKTGYQRLGCTHTGRTCNTRWTGRWPGDAECIEYGFVIDLGPDEEPLPDLNRFYAECDWDPAQQRIVRRTT
ncbi:hypothetical protein [Streptomyces sp. NPDC056165]|uniref:hypothetical protein n=1 Tax=Streptomyces sp. NPDC056165 TaxID=3345733 RepID=UPI0035E072F8